jgi:hypothetical protein
MSTSSVPMVVPRLATSSPCCRLRSSDGDVHFEARWPARHLSRVVVAVHPDRVVAGVLVHEHDRRRYGMPIRLGAVLVYDDAIVDAERIPRELRHRTPPCGA